MQATTQRVGAAIHVDPSIPREQIVVQAADGAESWGALYTPATGRVRTVVHVMHPRGDMSRHYVVPGLVAAGYAVFAANSRYLNNDRDMVQERILLDIAAGQRLLRDRGYEGLALFGNSGGGSLFAFYQAQACTDPPNRLRDIPGDPRLDLNAHDLPPAHAYISVASHPGQGLYMLRTIDPAVVDENDPTLTDASLDMYNPDNGYRPLPEPSHYSAEFIARYRQGQRARTARLDALAHAYLAQQRSAAEALRAPDFGARPLGDQLALRRQAALDRTMVIYRTLANPAFLDPDIEPNQRPLGSIFAPDPLAGNYAATGLGRVMTPRGWLSTWSGLSSKARLADNVAGFTVPTLIINALGDSDIYPAEAEAAFKAAAAPDKQFVSLEEAGHYLNPTTGSSLADPRERLIDVIVPWLRARLP
jgi:pimeloyl-ACP methyl ester carboxylesterase